jgi:hypothetical protein
MISAPGLCEIPYALLPPEVSTEQAYVPERPQLEEPRSSDIRYTPRDESTWDDGEWLRLATRLDVLNGLFAQNDKMDMEDTQSAIDREKKKLSEEKEAERKSEYETGKWGVALLTFSCIGSVVSIITGIALIATGVGVVAGCLILAGGLIQIGSQIMELTGGWAKIKTLLPGEDEDKKGAIISWIQIGITIFCLILAGAGAVTGGFSMVGENMSKGSALMGAIAMIGKGTSEIGQGITKRDLYNHKGAQKRQEAEIAKLNYHWKDLMENQEERVSDVKKIYEAIHTTFEANHDFVKMAWGH